MHSDNWKGKGRRMTREEAIIRLNRISNSLSRYCDVNDCIRGNCAKCYEALDMAIEALEQVPKRGKWLPIIEGNEFGEPYQSGIYCSECGETLGCEANFCPNCGARMEREEE